MSKQQPDKSGSSKSLPEILKSENKKGRRAKHTGLYPYARPIASI